MEHTKSSHMMMSLMVMSPLCHCCIAGDIINDDVINSGIHDDIILQGKQL